MSSFDAMGDMKYMMSEWALGKAAVIQGAVEGHYTVKAAARKLRISERRVKGGGIFPCYCQAIFYIFSAREAGTNFFRHLPSNLLILVIHIPRNRHI
jgi:hypothetical protein